MYPKADQFVSEGVPFIRANNLKDGRVTWSDMRYIEADLHTLLTSGHLLENDILVTTRGDIGLVAIVPSYFVGANINAQICLLRDSDKCDQKFAFQYLVRGKSKKQFSELTTGSALKQLPRKNLARVEICTPTLPEQRKIAGFLGAVDTKIAQLAEKKRLLEDYKKGCMQQLFSQKIRFKDDKGHDFPDWGEKRLGEMTTFSKGKGISKADITENGTTPCIRYGEIYTIYREHITAVQSSTNITPETLYLSQSGDVIIPASGEDPLDMARACCVEGDGIALGGDINVLRGSPNGVFLAYYLNNAKRKDIARYAQGNSVVHLYASQMRNLSVSLPHPDEQRKIAEFLSALDRKIDLVGAELDHARTFKQGLLQQMFV